MQQNWKLSEGNTSCIPKIYSSAFKRTLKLINMNSFTTRVELHAAKTAEDYELLHKEMEKVGFTRTIKSDDQKTYYLPMAEYNFIGTATTDNVFDLASKAAKNTGKKYSILVTKSAGRKWLNLEQVKD